MKKIGLTGGIASGKSSVAKTFRTLGVYVIDADALAREVVEPNTEGLNKIIAHFGQDILLENGSLNRKKLAAEIFTSETKRDTLESILHPLISQLSKERFEEIQNKGVSYALYEAPLLFEKNLHKDCDRTILVHVSFEWQLKRLMNRDNLDEIEAQKRIDSQMPLETKLLLADHTIDNNGSPAETEQHVVLLKSKLDRFYNVA